MSRLDRAPEPPFFMSISIPSSTAPETERRIQPLWSLLGLVSIGFHLSLIFSGLVPALIARPIHMALALPWLWPWVAQYL